MTTPPQPPEPKEGIEETTVPESPLQAARELADIIESYAGEGGPVDLALEAFRKADSDDLIWVGLMREEAMALLRGYEGRYVQLSLREAGDAGGDKLEAALTPPSTPGER